MPYPILNATNTLNFYELFKFINTGSNGLFFFSMLGVIWMVTFIGSFIEGRRASTAWMWASFFSTIIAIMFTTMGYLSKTFIYLLVLMLAVGAVWSKLAGARND